MRRGRRNKTLTALGVGAGCLLLLASPLGAQERHYYDWTAPPEFVSLKNPFPRTPEVLEQGEAIFKKRCLICHGPKGDGKGTSSLSLSAPPGDLTKKRRMRKQSDGALFWKIRVGRGEMPPWQLVLKDEEIWKVIRFLRKFSQ